MSNLRIVCKNGDASSVKVFDSLGNNICREASITAIDIKIRPNAICKATIVFENIAFDLLTQIDNSNESTRELSNYYPTVEEYEQGS